MDKVDLIQEIDDLIFQADAAYETSSYDDYDIGYEDGRYDGRQEIKTLLEQLRRRVVDNG